MKTKILSLLLVPALLLSGCASFQNFFNKIDPALIQAFGGALRSLEGVAIANVPAAIMALRNKWLPAGKQYDAYVASLIRSYLAAHPTTNAEVAKVLEALAIQLELNP